MRERRRGLTRTELLALPALVDPATAARAFGVGRTKAYELLRTGEFPVEVMQVAGRNRVRTADILRELGIDPDRVSGSAA